MPCHQFARAAHCTRQSAPNLLLIPEERLYPHRHKRLCIRSDAQHWRISEAGLRPRKSPAYFLCLTSITFKAGLTKVDRDEIVAATLAKENKVRIAVSAAAAVAAWLSIRHYNNGGFGGGHGGHGGHGGGGGGSAGDGSPQALAAQTLSEEEKKERKNKRPVHLTLVSFAVTRKAYETITARFADEYEAETGIPVKFRLSFGGSGTQARAVVDGLPGDIVALALPLDIMKIEEAGLIAPGWQDRAPNKGVVAESVVALVTRKGNPKGVKDWDDLTRSDVSVITANPKTAGVARWNFLALWGHQMAGGDQAAQKFVTDVFHRVPIQPRDAREASDVFYTQAQGDILLNYENEVFMTNNSYAETGQDQKILPYIVPQNNVRVETPVAIVTKNIERRPAHSREPTQACAEAFIQYLFTPEAQKEFAKCGFRVSESSFVADLPKVKTLWSVDEKLGGWGMAQPKFFDGGKILDQIQNEVGEFRMKERQAGRK